jgi:hypothetical protein
MTNVILKLFFVFGIMAFGAGSSLAQKKQFCEKTNYSAQDIADAVRNSTLRDELKQNSCALGGLGRFESSGNKGIYNGSCCTGIFQLNQKNIVDYTGMTPSEFGCQSLQFQVNTWAQLTNDAYDAPAVRTLTAMGGIFDGQKIDSAFLTACIQLGPANCNRMVKSGRCSGFADSNGTTICDMARNARSLATNCTEGSAACEMGPGDFTNSKTPVALTPPAPANTDVLVKEGQI